MNKEIINKIKVLAAVTVLSGCSGMETQQPILSAAEAQSSIRITVKPLEPAVDADTLVAVHD